MKNITKEEWKIEVAACSNGVLLDVRRPEECAEGMQENATQLNFLDDKLFAEGIKELDKTKTYYVYCRSGGRSAKACMLMDELGLVTYNLLGGMLEWDGTVVS